MSALLGLSSQYRELFVLCKKSRDLKDTVSGSTAFKSLEQSKILLYLYLKLAEFQSSQLNIREAYNKMQVADTVRSIQETAFNSIQRYLKLALSSDIEINVQFVLNSISFLRSISDFGKMTSQEKNIHFYWTIKKYLDMLNALLQDEQLKDVLGAYRAVLNEAMVNLGVSGEALGNQLWRNGHPTILNGFTFELRSQFLEILNSCPFERGSHYNLIFDPTLMLPESSKVAIFEGIATLRMIDLDFSEESSQLRTVLASVPQMISQQIQKSNTDIKRDFEALLAGKIDRDNRVRFPLSLATRISSHLLRFGCALVGDMSSIQMQLNVHGLIRELLSKSFPSVKIHPETENVKEMVSQLIEFSLRFSRRCLSDFEPLKRFLWILEAKELEGDREVQLIACFSEIEHSWFKALWKSSLFEWNSRGLGNTFRRSLVGDMQPVLDNIEFKRQKASPEKYANNILSPEVDAKLLLLMYRDQVPLYAINERKRQICDLTEMDYLLDMTNSRWAEQMIDTLVFNIRKVFDVVSNEMPMDLTLELSNALKSFDQGRWDNFARRRGILLNSVQAISKLFSTCKTGTPIGGLLKEYAYPLFTTFEVFLTSDGRASMYLLGKLWMMYSFFFIEAYIPKLCYDPNIISASEFDMLQATFFELQSDVIAETISKTLGIQLSERWLLALKDLQERQRTTISRLRYRPLGARASDLFSQFSYLQSSLLSPSSMKSVMKELDSGTYSEQNLLHMQDTLAAFVDALESRFVHFSDIVQPLSVALYQLKFGLHLAGVNQPINHDTKDMRLNPFKVIDPFSSNPFQSNLSQPLFSYRKDMKDGEELGNVELLRLSLCNFHLSSMFRPASQDAIDSLSCLFSAISEIFFRLDFEKQKREEEEAQMYKYKGLEVNIASEKELEDIEVNQYFPNFSEDVLNDANEPITKETSTIGTLAGIFSQMLPEIWQTFDEIISFWTGGRHSVAHLSNLHQILFPKAILSSFEAATSGQCNDKIRSEIVNNIDVICRAVAAISLGELTENERIESNARQMYGSIFRGLDEGLSNLRRPHNFYQDSNLAEAKILHTILVDLDAQLTALLESWPDHSVLQELSMICNRIAAFPISSPLMKFLTGVELLLHKCNDWEAYASKQFSLGDSMAKLTELIVKWRKLELESWQTLLDVEDFKAEIASSKLWFHLFRVIGEWLRGQEEYTSESANETIKVLDQFCLSASIGEFKGRLRMLKAFHDFIQLVLDTLGPNPKRTLILKLTWSIWRYYSQFNSLVSSHLDQARKPLLSDLMDYVKIATWKDVNVFALQESAKRSHHTLMKFIKKYTEILKAPVKDVIVRSISSEQSFVKLSGILKFKTPPVILEKFLFSPLSPSNLSEKLGERTLTLPKLFLRMNELLDTKFQALNITETSLALEDFSESVISRVDDFRNVNKTLEAGTKETKNQKVVRRRALVDLLKYLRQLGLSPRGSQILQHLKEPLFVHSQEKLILDFRFIFNNSHTAAIDLAERSNVYYFHNLALIAKLRDPSVILNDDIRDQERERALGFVENLLEITTQQRSAVALICHDLKPLLWQCQQMQIVSSVENPTTITGSKDIPNILNSLYLSATEICDDIVRITSLITALKKESSEPALLMTRARTAFFEWISKLRTCSNQFLRKHEGDFTEAIASDDVVIFLKNGSVIIEEVRKLISLAMETDSILSACFPNILFKADGLLEFLLASADKISVKAAPAHLKPGLSEAVDELVERILITCQDLLKPDVPKVADVDEFGLQAQAILKANRSLLSSLNPKSLKALKNSLGVTFVAISSAQLSGPESQMLLKHLLTPLSQVIAAYELRIFQLLSFHKTLCKLSNILSRIFLSLFQVGFSLPRAQEESGETGASKEVSDGMGLGDGEGTKDVSNEIDNQDQVEELKDSNPKANDKSDTKTPKSEKDAVEMDYDIDGELSDVSDREGNDEEEDEDEDEDKVEGEEQMGELDDNLADVVDEKMWDDNEPSHGDKDEKTESDAPVDSQGETETVAQTQSSEAGEKDRNDTEKAKKAEEMKDENDENAETEKMMEDNELINEDRPENYEDSHGIDIKEPNPDESGLNDLDLPDDLNLDDPMNEGPTDDSNEQQGDDGDELGRDINTEMPDSSNEHAPGSEEEDCRDEVGETFEPTDENGEESDDSKDEQDVNGDDAMHLDANNEFLDPEKEMSNDDQNNPEPAHQTLEKAKQAPQTFGIQQQGQDSVLDASIENGGGAEDSSKSEELDASQAKDPKSYEKAAGSSDESKKDRDDLDPNPQRSLGDSLKKWMSRIVSISNPDDGSKDSASQEDMMDTSDETGDYEFVKEGEDSNSQAIANATSQQSKEMEKFVPKEEPDADIDDQENIDEMPKGEKRDSQDYKDDHQRPENIRPFFSDADKPNNDASESEESLDEEDVHPEQNRDDISEMDVDDTRRHIDFALENNVDDLNEPENNGKYEESKSYDDLVQEMQTSLQEFRNSGQDLQQAQTLWRQYSSLTNDSAFALCESLRLILEPTLATKMRGDYKTGKRLNMRKVVPYIASQFKKDKIWLRRTKPFKRNYQIMLAIDDSRSMAESKSVELAYESLAIISKALTQLEVGEMAVASFGENVRLLHPFESVFSDDAGANVIRSFTFAQERTNVRQMMATTAEMLSNARAFAESSGHGRNGELWQLQIIVSDGICEDHSEIRALVRRAAQAKIMVVFIILDRRKERDAIMKISNVTYNKDPKTGRMALKMTRYMDTFPFDYYLVLKDASELPEVLADTLRQYLMYISN
ncbi:hypothetical protein HDU97_006250 [Phlyctochytrium planicorne]|nr:hypothetical protein HDU97_006250 [Phlyctochytrium planicorne]